MLRCQGYNKHGKKCRTRIKNSEIYCCPSHKPKNHEDILEECNICCSELNNSELKILKCGHAHHRSCLVAWMDTTRDSIPECPLCRTPIYWNRNNATIT
jgi:hypothetical protein